MVDADNHDLHDYLTVPSRSEATSPCPMPSSIVNSSKSTEQDPSSPSSTISITSLPSNPSPKNSLSSFFRVPSPHRKTPSSPSSEDRFMITFIRNPSTSPQRTSTVTEATVEIDEPQGNNGSTFFKGKVTAAFNQMKYRWAAKMRPNFRTNDSPIYFLGKLYNEKQGTIFDDTPRSSNNHCYTKFLHSVGQRIFFSYRKSFEPVAGSRHGTLITSDCGWGCMIRCAQMLLAQTLLLQRANQSNSSLSNYHSNERLMATKSVERSRFNSLNRHLNDIYTEIIRYFGDFRNPKCPFSIHKIVELGDKYGIRPGEFFGPASAAQCLKDALQIAIDNQDFPDTLRIYISRDAIVYRQDVLDLFGSKSTESFPSIYPSLDYSDDGESSTRNAPSVLILIPLRLGLNELDLIYEEYLKEALKIPQTVGIMGGSPRHAVYIIGFQDDCFIDLDPHLCQTTVNVLESKFDLSSYSCSSPKTLTARKMDPSCALGFFCRDTDDFNLFCSKWNRVCDSGSRDQRACPIFRIEQGTFEENHYRTLNTEYSSLNDDQNVFLRVTKVAANHVSAHGVKKFHHHGKTRLMNTSANQMVSRDSWDDADFSLANHQQHRNSRLRSLSDDYVFL